LAKFALLNSSTELDTKMRHLTSVCLGAAVLLLSAQFPTLAQSLTSGQGSRQIAASPLSILEPVLPLPNLPPLQPTLPDVQQETRLVLRIGQRRVYVYQGEAVKASYPVAVGRAGWETPTGQFKVIEKIRNPGWTNPFTGEVAPPGPDNPLGERWIAFWTDGKNFVGFHGTPNPESVGRAASHGCVRMFNADIRKLFEMVKVGTPVIVER
jgi:L,D-transpeptidase ErfK/SrfK